ncbi:MAG: c-type cytochrome, partial [Acidobacteria bacterium]|nr:c-type cytochrome [Acidobacteriota bacterium]
QPHPDPLRWDTRFAAIAWRLHPTAAIAAFKTRAGSPRLTARARQQAIVALGFVDDAQAAQAMADLTQARLEDVASQAGWWMAYRRTNLWRAYPVDGWTAAVPAVTAAGLPEMLEQRTTVVDATAPIDRRIDAAIAMARTRAGGLFLIQLAADRGLDSALRDAVGSVIFASADRGVRTAAAGYFRRPGDELPMSITDAAGRNGDPARGQQRYQAASCGTCHRLGGAGGEVGPDLTEIHRKFERVSLIDAIVNPTAAIATGYDAELFVSRQQGPNLGMLLSDGATITIRDDYGRTIVLPRDDLAARVPLKSSLMPDALTLALTDQDVADIAAYLLQVPR